MLEFAGIGAAPMAAMLLGDLGAEVLRIDRREPAAIGIEKPLPHDLLVRNRRSAIIDLKHAGGIACARDLAARADILIEGFRPGTMERLGLGPDSCLKRNPALVYGRLTGWGQTGPLARTAGHDLNYVALSGALHAIGRAGEQPTPPLNLLGDFAGGGLLLAFGVLAALTSARATGRGQVVDAAMAEGSALLMTSIYGLHGAGMHGNERGTNLLDSGAPHYDSYACADGRYVAVAPIEGRFRRILLEGLGFDPDGFPDVADPANWPEARRLMSERLRTRPRDEWCALFADSDACLSPVLSMAEAPAHPHAMARESFLTVDGVVQPAPAPRFSATPAAVPKPPEAPGASTEAALRDWGIDPTRIAALLAEGAIGTGRHSA